MRRKSLLGPIAISLAMLAVGCGAEGMGPPNLLDIGPPPPQLVPAPVILNANGTIIVPEVTVVVRGDSVRWFQVGGDGLIIHLESIPEIGESRSGAEAVVVAIPTQTRVDNYKYDVTVVRGVDSFTVDPRLLVRAR